MRPAIKEPMSIVMLKNNTIKNPSIFTRFERNSTAGFSLSFRIKIDSEQIKNRNA
jgi:hypothetical protein